MEKKMYIIMGRSGGGKGTQVDLFKKYLEGKGTEGVHHVTTGGGFRAFVQGDTFAAKQARLINDRGGLQPGFLAVWNWTNIFINELKEGETLILDGAPRKLIEQEILKDAVPFFGFAHPTIIYLDVSKDWAMDKLRSRGREDDKDMEAMERKMKWFDDDVYPCVEAYKNDTTYTFVHVNGEQTVEEVHNELIAKLEAAENSY